MTAFQKQLEAIGSALLLIEKLPKGSVYSLTSTNDDDAKSPSVLNIYYKDNDEAEMLMALLRLGDPVDISDDDEFASWRKGILYISLIHHKEN